MNRNELQRNPTHRTASRRLHRRLSSLSASRCVVAQAAAPAIAPSAMVSLPQDVVRQAGMFELLAAEMRIAELEKALAEANAAAFTDPLTGALNRRGFEHAYQRELSRARRNGNGLALVHIDLDDFKAMNDDYGHQAGDRALIHLVDSLHKSMRPTDILCRFGGEEFILILVDTTLVNAVNAVSRFLQEFSATPITGTGKRMTFSAGVVAHAADEALDQVIGRADAATYTAKLAGKNRVVVG